MSRKFYKQFTEDVAVAEAIGRGLLASGTTLPTDATAGYLPGCVFIKTNGAAGASFYVNRGSATSCSFKTLDTGGLDLSTLVTTAAELNKLSGLLATAAEINRNNQTSTRVVSATTTLTVTQALHEGRIILLNASGGFSSALPAATGSGNRFQFCVGTVSGTGYIINTADQGGADTDIFQGSVFVGLDAAATGKDFKTASTSNRITLNGSTTGGATVGDMLYIQDIAAGVYAVEGSVIGTSTIATPFSHV